MTRVAGCLQLLSEAFSGKKQACAFPVALLLVGRDRRGEGLPLLRHLLLLLLYGLTFPAACHLRNLISKFMGCIRRYNLPIARRLSNNVFSGKAPIRETVSQNLRGLPDRGRIRLVPKKKEPTPADTVLLNCSHTAWQAEMTPSSCSKCAARHIVRRRCGRCVHVRNEGRTRGNCLAGKRPVPAVTRGYRPGSANPEPARSIKRTRAPGAGPDGRRAAESFPLRPAPGLHADSVLEKEPGERGVRRFARGRSGDRVGMETSEADRHSRHRARAALSRLRPPVTQSRRSILHRPSHQHAFTSFWSTWPGQECSRGPE